MEAMTRAASADLRGVIASAAAGDELAFGRIVAEHHEDMRRVCVFVARDEVVADDAVQAAWSIAWRKLGSVRDPERLRSWLMRVAINEAKHLMRRRRHRAELEVVIDASREPGGIDPAVGIDRIDLLSAMARLDPDDRALLALRYGAGFDATELSATLGLSPSGVRSRLERIIRRMRQELRDG
jgi:RNA polymerase sigma-70 factor (ECF subfamily)